MKKLIFAAVVALFAACTTDVTEDVAVAVPQSPETLTVSFEEDSRIQLNDEQKTVWTAGDCLSIFNLSNANQKWQYQGETGERTGIFRRISAPEATQEMTSIVAVYPYNANYYINSRTFNVKAFMPTEQTYLKDSYGLNGNIMVSQSEYKQFSLKSVCGWLKIQLVGDGQVVKKITLKGNNGEQVAGEIYINTADATAILAAEQSLSDDGTQVGGTMLEDDTIFTEVSLVCPDGVTLSDKPTAFFIALPPQTFSKGFAMTVLYDDDTTMTKSTTNKTVIERNTVQPMEALYYNGDTPPVYELAYTTNNGKPLDPYTTEGFGSDFVENIYDAETGRGALKFNGKITTIPTNAFVACTNLTWIDIPNTITKIGSSAFQGCASVEQLTLPSSITSIGSSSFDGCSGRVTINCEMAFDDFKNAKFTEVVIGDNVTSIESSAFMGCSSLRSITIPDSITEIESSAFRGCRSLASITIPDGIQHIKNFLFSGCSSLTSVTIPDSVTSIGNSAFEDCSSLTSVIIPNKVTSIRSSVFQDCSSLESITIPNGVTSIGSSAFQGCSSLESITIPNRVTSIGESAFEGCSSLESIAVPDSVTSIEKRTFYECTSLTSVTIGNRVTSIGNQAFRLCSSLESFTIPDSVTLIEVSAFANCNSLASVYINDLSAWCKISFVDSGSNPMCYGAKLFLNNSEVTELAIPSDITEIKGYTFYGSDSIESVNIHDNVTSIGKCAFRDCSGLTSITIPSSVALIGNGAFYYSQSLASVYCKSTTPPIVDKGDSTYWYTFGVNASGFKIYVPEESVDAYKATDGWSDFASYIVPDLTE